MKRLALTVLAVFAVFLSGTVAYADSLDDTFSVSATVTGACTISAADLAFGSYLSNQGSPVNGTSQITVNCSVGQTWTVALDSGLNYTNCGGNRCMSDGSSHYLYYNIYRNDGFVDEWSTGANARTSEGTGSDDPNTAYGRIAANQSIPPGSYSDTITATITW